MDNDLVVVGHNYQTGKTQNVCDFVYGTSGIIKNAKNFAGRKVLFCGVMYMAEDLYVMSGGKAEVYIPEVVLINGEPATPRCPMIYPQGETPVVDYSHIAEARALKPDLVLAYINTPASMKAAADGVYNGTSALQAAEKIAAAKGGKGKIALVGDWHVNEWIKRRIAEKFPKLELITIPGKPSERVFCPTHVRIDSKKFIARHKEMVKKYGRGDVGLTLHAEVDDELLDYGLSNDAYFGWTDGIVTNVVNSAKKHHVVGTVEGAVEQIRNNCGHDVWSPNAVCANMAFTLPSKVRRAKEILADGRGPVAELMYSKKTRPYYEVKILRPELVVEAKSQGATIQQIPAARLVVSGEIAKGAYRALSILLGS